MLIVALAKLTTSDGSYPTFSVKDNSKNSCKLVRKGAFFDILSVTDVLLILTKYLNFLDCSLLSLASFPVAAWFIFLISIDVGY